MNLEKLALLKVRRKIYAWAVSDCDVWMNEIKRMGGNTAKLEQHKEEYFKILDDIDSEISYIRTAIDSLEDKTISKILIMRYDQECKISEIAEEMNYSTQWIHELINRGISKLK